MSFGKTAEGKWWKFESAAATARLNKLSALTPAGLSPSLAYTLQGCMMCDTAVTGIKPVCGKSVDCGEERGGGGTGGTGGNNVGLEGGEEGKRGGGGDLHWSDSSSRWGTAG